MTRSIYKQVRLMVLFDLPTESVEEKKSYTKFRSFLLKDGFLMLQYSVYTRFCHNDSDCEKHISRVQKNAPMYGNVRLVKITEKQFQNILILTGTKTINEKIKFDKELIIIE